MRTLDEAMNYFMYHSPDEAQREKYEQMNSMWQDVVVYLWTNIPPYNGPSPDKTLVLRRLSDTRMLANMSIACYVPPKPPQGGYVSD